MMRLEDWVTVKNHLKLTRCHNSRTDPCDLPDPGNPAQAIGMISCDSVVIENNTIDLDNPIQIRHNVNGVVHCFNNRTPDGRLLYGQDDVTHKLDPELADAIEEATLFSL